jgi:serine/threonine protein kinase
VSELVNEDSIGELRAGTTLGHYSVVRRIGAGAMGAVYEGARDGTGDRVALKVLDPRFAAVARARDRFLAEAKIAERLHHPNIVAVTEAGDDDGRPFLVMELLGGEDLAQRLERSRPIPAEAAADILIPVCGAIAAAHAAGVTHRDLKPHNIFLAQPSETPKVLDFGIAMAEGVVPAETKTDDAAGVVGSPCYLAPEQVGNGSAAGPASDQYALAVIAYECLTGQRPFDGETLDAVLAAIAAGAPRPPTALQPELPAELEAIVLRAMSRQPSERFASVTELGRALLPFASPKVRLAWETTFGSPDAKVNGTPGEGEERAPRRRSLSSPAIQVEAATKSPFVRTLPPEAPDLSAVPEVTPARPRRIAPWQGFDVEVPKLTRPWGLSPDRIASLLASTRIRVAAGAVALALGVVVVLALRASTESAPAAAPPAWVSSAGSRSEPASSPKPAGTQPKPSMWGSAAPPPKPAVTAGGPIPGAPAPPKPAVAGPDLPVAPPAEPAPEVEAVPPPVPAAAAPPATSPPPAELPPPAPAVASAPAENVQEKVQDKAPEKPSEKLQEQAQEKAPARSQKAGTGIDDEGAGNAAKSDRRPARDSDAAQKRRVPLLD